MTKSKIQEVAEEYMAAKEDLENLKLHQSQAQKRFDEVRKIKLPALMEEMGIDNVKITGIGRISIRQEAYAGMNKDHKVEAYEWLEANGHGDLIQPTVNGSTLKAFLKEQVKKGEIIPDDLFNFTPFEMAIITKA